MYINVSSYQGKAKGEKSDSLKRGIKVDKRHSHCRLITSQPVSKVLTVRVILDFAQAMVLSRKILNDKKVFVSHQTKNFR